MKRINIIMTLACSLLIPAAAYAVTCHEAAKTLHQMTTTDSLRNSFFERATIALFEESLGQGEKNLTPESLIEYKWVCPEDNTTTISIISKDGTNIDGFFGVILIGEETKSFSATSPKSKAKEKTHTKTEQPTNFY